MGLRKVVVNTPEEFFPRGDAVEREEEGRLDDLLRLIRLLTHAAVVDLRKKLLLLLQGVVVFCLV